MSKPKEKQQKSLLAFFSPPSGVKTSSTKKDVDQSSQKSAVKRKEPCGNIKKKIEFSPKNPSKAAEPITKSIPTKSPAKSITKQKSSPPTNTTRVKKSYEEFLGTSSEEDDDEYNPSTPSKSSQRRTAASTVKKKKVIADESSEEDSAYSSGSEDDPTSEEDDLDLDSSEEEEEEEDLPPRKRLKRGNNTKKSTKEKKSIGLTPRKASNDTGSFLSPPPSSASSPPPSTTETPSAVDAEAAAVGGVYGAGCHLHDRLPWLNEKRRDINGNAPDSPSYDPRTLYIPSDFLKKETPAMIQWWEVKSRNMDTVLFFKVGKFYELFHMDADIGFQELNLIYMKGEKAHSGFPEIAYGKMSSQLITKGYRVARVEQTETPEMMKERNAQSKQKAKVVRREICSMLSLGTNTNSFLDGTSNTTGFLMAIKEQEQENNSSTDTQGIEMGFCLLDASTGLFQLGQFQDTVQRDRLKTLLAQHEVVEIINERNALTMTTKMVLKHMIPRAFTGRSELTIGKEFWHAERTLEEIRQAGYFPQEKSQWPIEILKFLDEETKEEVKINGRLAISALGGCIWHLRRSLIDQELVSMCNFKRYTPPDHLFNSTSTTTNEKMIQQKYMVLDAQTIQNLEILQNSFNGKRSGSLIEMLDKTVTGFGRRLFQEWVLKPLCQVEDIQERLQVVDFLGQHLEIVQETRDILRQLPDLERLLSRIHANGLSHRSKEHPDSRAIMYEASIYNVRKIRDFVSVLQGFEKALKLVQKLQEHFFMDTDNNSKKMVNTNEEISLPPKTLCRLFVSKKQTNPEGRFPDFSDRLAFFHQSFDAEKAQQTGIIIPSSREIDLEFDTACDAIEKIEKELEIYLKEQKKILKCQQIIFFHTKKKEDRYQLEIPDHTGIRIPSNYELKSKKKNFKRFHTKEIRFFLQKLQKAEEQKNEAIKDQMRKIFKKFDQDYLVWQQSIQCLAILDCFCSLTIVSSTGSHTGIPWNKPHVQKMYKKPFLDIKEGIHPCVAANFGLQKIDFVPNDTQIGIGDQVKGSMILLSGPNMGGKSTLLRQTCILILMAQIGCFVPAKYCSFSPVDRIFTRIGASDRILQGQSTLFVELNETATILNHASQHSLVILDELGRGTSTFDGTAIAYAVVEHLLRKIQCRTLFATHYHSLVEEYLHEPENVTLCHMGCLVDPENEKKVTFLYKLEDGMCPKSYGLNVAMLANLPMEVIELAAKKSKQFEKAIDMEVQEQKAKQIYTKLKSLLSSSSSSDEIEENIQQLWTQANALMTQINTHFST